MTRSPLSTFVAEHDEELADLALDLIAVDTQNPPGETREAIALLEAESRGHAPGRARPDAPL